MPHVDVSQVKKVIKRINDSKIQEGQTKENFMDYIDPDSNRKMFGKEQIDIILK